VEVPSKVESFIASIMLGIFDKDVVDSDASEAATEVICGFQDCWML